MQPVLASRVRISTYLLELNVDFHPLVRDVCYLHLVVAFGLIDWVLIGLSTVFDTALNVVFLFLVCYGPVLTEGV